MLKSLYLGPINKFANEKQKELYLKPYTTGKKIGIKRVLQIVSRKINMKHLQIIKGALPCPNQEMARMLERLARSQKTWAIIGCSTELNRGI